MSQRYGSYDGNVSENSDDDNDEDYDDIILKLTEYTTIGGGIDRVSAFNSDWGDKFLVGLNDVEVLDGVVFQRKDSPDTYKVISLGDIFDVNEDGDVVDTDEDDNPVLTSEEIADHGKVAYFDETFAGDTYDYNFVGVAVEAYGDDPVEVGETTMMLANSGWVRKFAKILTAEGNSLIEQTTGDDGNTVPVSDAYGWLTTMEPTLRDGFEGRDVEMWIEEDSFTPSGADEEIEYTKPIVLDSSTGEQVGVANGDGGGRTGDNDSDESGESTSGSVGGSSSPVNEEFSDEVEELIDYFVRTDETDYDTMEAMLVGQAGDSIDVDAIVSEVESRQEA
jgi:hypothetical protein